MKRLWKGIFECVRRPLAALPGKPKADVSGRQGRLWQSVAARALTGSTVLLSHLPDMAWLLSTLGETTAGKHDEKAKQKKQTGLAVHKKYAHPQDLLDSGGRGDKPSPRRH